MTPPVDGRAAAAHLGVPLCARPQWLVADAC